MPNSATTPGTQDAASIFGQWLKERRNALDLTRQELADKIGCSAETVHKMETGARRPSRQVAEIVAAFFNVPTDEREAFIGFARGQGSRGGDQRGVVSREHPWRGVQKRLTTIPAQVTSLIGRDEEIEQVRALMLRDSVRLLTLVGPPGIGKTRLALAVAAQRLDSLEDGVFFVPLAPVIDPNLVVPTIAKVLDVKEVANQPIFDIVARYLRDKRALLVLDNFEQVMEAGPQVGQLLAECPWLKVLVTSRDVLHIYGERQYLVPPLALPDITRLDVEALSRYASIALFVESAQAVKPDFSLTEENGEAIAGVCVHLGGLPLAIELAAARTRLFAPHAMLEKLSSTLSLLTGGARDLPPRHQTLRNAIKWSYDLLDVEEQKLFRRLGVFVGGWTLVALEAVCNPEGDLIRGAGNVLESLLDKSLLQQQVIPHSALRTPHSESVRFSMLEAMREYALERLAESGEAEALKRLHAEYFLALVEAVKAERADTREGGWLERLELEHDNVRAALSWARASGEIDLALRMSVALGTFWTQRHVSEGRAQLDAVLALAEGIATADHAKALFRAGTLAGAQSDFAGRRRFFQESLDIARKLGPDPASKDALATALLGMMHITDQEGDYALARQHSEERLAIVRELGDMSCVASALNNLGLVASHEGNYELAHHYYEEGLKVAHQIGDKDKVGIIYINLGDIARGRYDYATARSFYEESLAIWEELRNVATVALLLHNLGHVARHEGNYGEAIAQFARSLAIAQERGNKVGLLKCLAGISAVWGAQGDVERAARLSGSVDALLAATGGRLDPTDRLEYERSLAAIREQLGKEKFDQAWAEGQGMSLEEAMGLMSG